MSLNEPLEQSVIALALQRRKNGETKASSAVRLRVLPPPFHVAADKPIPELDSLPEEAGRAAVLRERKKIARDLPDTLAQGFTGVIIQLEAADDAYLAGDHESAARHVLRAASLARESLSETRRCVHGLRLRALESTPFDEALKRFVADATEGTTVRTNVQIRGRVRDLPPHWYTNLLHIAQEALSNTLKHACATSFCVRLSATNRNLRLEFRDNGIGLGATVGRDGIGLAGMRERVQEIGGALSVTSSRGGGTRILVTRPYAQPIGSPAIAAQCYPESGSDSCDFPAAENSLACAQS